MNGAKIAGAAAALLLAACAHSGGSFTQYEGFAAIRAGLGSAPPNEEEQALLARHRPVLHVANGEEGPIDFYADYISSGELHDGEKRIINPNAAQLNAARHNLEAVFIHHPQKTENIPAVYGGVSRAVLTLTGGEAREFTFLSYHFVFRNSGLPAGVAALPRRLAEIFSLAEDWHQLDHYTAAFLVLDKNTPFAVILQQHNYMRTYFINEEPAFLGGRLKLDAAIDSNELYPHREGRQKRRAAGFINAKTAAYLTGESDYGGLHAAPDITEGGREIKYELQFLPPDDAFYVFEGRLGEARRLPGRDGPPGAIYRTLPKFWHLQKALYAFYWKEGDSEYVEILRQHGRESETAQEKFLARFSRAFYNQ